MTHTVVQVDIEQTRIGINKTTLPPVIAFNENLSFTEQIHQEKCKHDPDLLPWLSGMGVGGYDPGREVGMRIGGGGCNANHIMKLRQVSLTASLKAWDKEGGKEKN